MFLLLLLLLLMMHACTATAVCFILYFRAASHLWQRVRDGLWMQIRVLVLHLPPADAVAVAAIALLIIGVGAESIKRGIVDGGAHALLLLSLLCTRRQG